MTQSYLGIVTYLLEMINHCHNFMAHVLRHVLGTLSIKAPSNCLCLAHSSWWGVLRVRQYLHCHSNILPSQASPLLT